MDSISLYTCSIISEMIELEAGAKFDAAYRQRCGFFLPKLARLNVIEVLTSLFNKHQVGNFIL